MDASDADLPRFLERIATRVRADVDVDDVAVTRFSPPDRWDVVHATSAGIERLEDLTFTVGQGPTWDAWQGRRPVLVPDLAGMAARSAWPAWTAGALELGFRSAAVLLVRVGTVTLGTLSLYRRTAGAFTDHQVERAGALADAVLVGLLDEMAGTEPGADPSVVREFFSASVYQASGMVMVQLGLDATQALLALRAHAFAVGRPLREVADDVVARRFRFSTDGDPA